jgi:hypothetical protein
MANITITTRRISPVGGANSLGDKLSFIPSTIKAAQNDTITVDDAREILHASLVIVASGVAEPCTISGNVITLTSVTTGSVRGTIIYR